MCKKAMILSENEDGNFTLYSYCQFLLKINQLRSRLTPYELAQLTNVITNIGHESRQWEGYFSRLTTKIPLLFNNNNQYIVRSKLEYNDLCFILFGYKEITKYSHLTKNTATTKFLN